MKKTNTIGILLAMVVLESALVIILIVCRYEGVHFIIRSRPVISSPLELALEYQSPDKKFEELVKMSPSWMRYRISLPDGTRGMPILASCAILNLTNHVKILIANGADAEESIGSLKQVGADEAIKLIQQVKSEFQNQGEREEAATNAFISNDTYPSR